MSTSENRTIFDSIVKAFEAQNETMDTVINSIFKLDDDIKSCMFSIVSLCATNLLLLLAILGLVNETSKDVIGGLLAIGFLVLIAVQVAVLFWTAFSKKRKERTNRVQD